MMKIKKTRSQVPIIMNGEFLPFSSNKNPPILIDKALPNKLVTAMHEIKIPLISLGRFFAKYPSILTETISPAKVTMDQMQNDSTLIGSVINIILINDTALSKKDIGVNILGLRVSEIFPKK